MEPVVSDSSQAQAVETKAITGRYASSSPRVDRLLGGLFCIAEKWPRTLHRLAPLLARVTWLLAGGMRQAIRFNLSQLLPANASSKRTEQVGQSVVRNFIRFIADLGLAQHQSQAQIVDRVTNVEGQANYERARAMGKGAIIATAHLGSFEVGLAVTANREKAVHVVFATDPFPRFDRMRTALREKLGVQEARAEDGWEMWGQLRDALAADEVVVMQADRVMPGQKGMVVQLSRGRAELPTGPVRLAQLSGAPILPVFAVRESEEDAGNGQNIRIVIEEPIVVQASGDPKHAQSAAMDALASALGRQIEKHPAQWLMLHRVWQGDATNGV